MRLNKLLNNDNDENISKKVFGSVNDLPAKDKISIVQDKLINLQKKYFESKLQVIYLQSPFIYCSDKDSEIEHERLLQREIEMEYNAFNNELKKLEDSNND